MTPAQSRYLAVEAAIGAIFAGTFSLGFCALFFARLSAVPVFGNGLIVDAAPQTFMVTLLAGLFATLLARKRIAAGALAPAAGGLIRLPRNAVLRVGLLALIVTPIGVGLTALSLFAGPEHLPILPVLVAKTVYGAVLGAAVAAGCARRA